MYIKEIKIVNFRGINIHIKNINNDCLVIGKNDAGKSNLCYAIRKVLEYDIRKIPLDISDSTNSNCENIEISLKFNIDKMDSINRNRISKKIENDEDGEYYYTKLLAIFNKETLRYDEQMVIGKIDEERKSISQSLPLDTALNIIYVNPNYSLSREEKEYFTQKKIYMDKNNLKFDDEITEKIINLNSSIANDTNIIDFSNEINTNQDFKKIFDDIQFNITSNIDISNFFKSLKVQTYTSDDKSIVIGDGKSKTLALLLQKLANQDQKEKIFLIEEPENHMYPIMQKIFASIISKFGTGQTIYTSHSPYIVDFKKMNQIIKLTRINNIVTYSSLNINENDYKSFGYLLNDEIAQMFFCNEVLLVEGFSEKIFYNLLYIQDEIFKKYVDSHALGVFCVGGIDFTPAKSILEKLNIKVYIKTDNDKYGLDKKHKFCHYAGIERCLNCLSIESKDELKKLINVDEINKDTFRYLSTDSGIPVIEQSMKDIINIFNKNRIILSNQYDGFERDFLEFIDSKNIEEDISYLKQSKMKNLHKFINDEDIILKINDTNKTNPLVRFIYE